jgi:hypothetical protein
MDCKGAESAVRQPTDTLPPGGSLSGNPSLRIIPRSPSADGDDKESCTASKMERGHLARRRGGPTPNSSAGRMPALHYRAAKSKWTCAIHHLLFTIYYS